METTEISAKLVLCIFINIITDAQIEAFETKNQISHISIAVSTGNKQNIHILRKRKLKEIE